MIRPGLLTGRTGRSFVPARSFVGLLLGEAIILGFWLIFILTFVVRKKDIVISSMNEKLTSIVHKLECV